MWYKEMLADLRQFAVCPQDGIESLSRMEAAFDGSMSGWTWPERTSIQISHLYTPTLDGLWAMALEKAVKAISCDILTRILVEQQLSLQYNRLY